MKSMRVFLLVLVLLAVGLFGWRRFQESDVWFRTSTSGEAVVKQLQELSRLETSVFTIEKVIDAGTEGNQLQQFLFGDRILLIAHGQVIAGFDLSLLNAEDVVVDGGTVRVNLPAPEILVTSLDNEKSRVYDRQQGLLTRGETGLESEARQEAEAAIQQAACVGGILEEAASNGRKQLEAWFKALGYESVVIEVSVGDC